MLLHLGRKEVPMRHGFFWLLKDIAVLAAYSAVMAWILM